MPMYYSPIVLDSINHSTFPKVELYVKNDNKFTLYKPSETNLTIHNIERLRENGTEFVYIDSTDSEEVQEHIEKNFDGLQSTNRLSQLSKNLICSQIIISCINDIFKNPSMAAAFHKCRIILKQVSLKFEDRHELISFFSKLEQNFDTYLVTHSAQVTILSMYMYEELFNAGKTELIDIGVGAMLHDIGMLYISSDITGKTDVLSDNEYYRVKIHPKHGCSLLRDAGIDDQIVIDITLDHHERYDGSGYPRGLNGERIPRHAMLVSICDIYCALTMNRPYKSASTPEDALDTLKEFSRIFDPEILSGFLKIMTNTALPEKVVEERNKSVAPVKNVDTTKIQEFRKRMRDYSDDRNRLLQLHSVLTDDIKNSYGEEKANLIAFRSELKDLLNSLFVTDGQKGPANIGAV